MEEEKPRKLTFEEVMNRYEEMINDEYDFPFFSSYYITDNTANGKPYIVKSLWFSPIPPHSRNENNKYVLLREQKANFKNKLIETFNKENIYLI